YLEMSVAGVSFFSSQIVDEDYESLFDNQTRFHGTAFTLSGGAGVLLRISECMKLDIGLQASRGQKTWYRSVAPESANLRLSLEDGQAESFTHHLNYRMGLVFGF
ncbi:MAG: hypothetical protein AAFO94_06000, partial [Bacteroidota bacterium]